MMSVSRQSVHELIQRKVIDRGDDGLIDVEMARLAIANRVRPSAKSAALVASSAQAHEPASPATPASDDQAITSYHVAKTLREAAEAKLAQLKLAQMRGELVPADAVRAAWAKRVAGLRESLLQLPSRVVPLLVADTTPAVMDQTLRAEIVSVLTMLSEAD